MLTELFTYIGVFAIDLISFFSYFGVFFLMVLESMIFPMPSELVMPFAGFLVAEGRLNFVLVVVFSSLGSLVGSLASYYIGKFGGNRFVLRFGKYFLLDIVDLEKTEKWFRSKGEKTVFVSRLIPVVRHLISIPAGIGKMNLKKFIIYTLVGATVWNSFLAYLGYLLGKNWGEVRHYSEYVSIFVFVVLIVVFIWFIYKHISNKKRVKIADKELFSK